MQIGLFASEGCLLFYVPVCGMASNQSLWVRPIQKQWLTHTLAFCNPVSEGQFQLIYPLIPKIFKIHLFIILSFIRGFIQCVYFYF